MALFEACSKQFIKDTGRSTLRPILDLNTSTRCSILCVVTRKKSRWFWRADTYKSTPFTLNELLTKPVVIKGHIEKSTFISDYKNEPKFHVSGKLGGKIASEFGIDASAIDSFTISMNVGTVLKREVTWDNLKKVLADTTLNLDHEYVQYILAKQRRSLCIIYETVATKGDTDLDSDSKEEGDAGVSVGKPKFFIKLTGSIELEHHRSYELPSNTILGYACYEVKFDPDMGTFELVLPDETDAGGEIGKKYCLFDEPDGQKDKALTAVFDDLLKSPRLGKIISLYKEILSYPEAVAPLRDMLEKALSAVEKKSFKPLEMKEFQTKAGPAFGSLKELLLLIGFNIDDSGEGSLTFSQDSDDGLLLCCTALAEALVELSAAQCQTIKEVTSQYLEPLLYLLKNTMVGKTTSIDDPLLQRLWTHSSNPAKAFLLSVGFDQVMEGNQKVLCLKWDFEQISLEDVYVAVFVMCTKI
ncbi:unnamed protein product [Pocillopora meandrina]|uniref:Gasdermin pore forming domain-containing protein n=1 Tax=Pocillopora meandrina TaxID=46732 RepID=A0AAU9WZX5_9CNID|nr:unnamed protein product [Pocillopora meandrina]